jgi:hypothetical protein
MLWSPSSPRMYRSQTMFGFPVISTPVLAPTLALGRPLGGHLVADPGHVLQHDAGLAVDEALDLEPKPGLGPGFDRSSGRLHRMVQGGLLVQVPDLVQGDPQPGGDLLHHRPPHHRQDPRRQQHRDVLQGLAEPHGLEQDLGLVVRGVVQDLHHPHRVDPLAHAEEHQRQEVVGESRVNPVHVAGSPGVPAGLLELLHLSRKGSRRRIDERRQRGGDHVLAGGQGPADVLDGLHRAEVAGGRVADRVGFSGQRRLDVGGGEHAGRLQPRQLAGVAALLRVRVDDDPGQLELRMGDHRPEGVQSHVAGSPTDHALGHPILLSGGGRPA